MTGKGVMSDQAREARIEDILQEIAYTQGEIHDKKACLERLEAELVSLGGLTPLDSALVEIFKCLSQVSAIYRHDHHVWVFHDNPVYDAQLMDTLIWFESDFLDAHGDHLFFRHAPDVLAPARQDGVGKARLLYSRKS